MSNIKSAKKKPGASAAKIVADSPVGPFPIVCIGASAGGLEALEQFLSNVPVSSGMGYVIIQHLDPTQKGMLPELLQRVTDMEVFQVKDRMAVRPNCVYVIPPNKTMSILNGLLHLFEPIEARGLRLPIDFFFRSLADDRRELAVGVILSGMGSDGSIGVRAIKEKNGIIVVQEPSSAKFDSMPRNAIDSVLVDILAPANELPSKLISLFKHLPVVKSNLEIEIKDHSALEKIIILLRTQTGNDFSLYKKNTIYRRIERRMGIHKIDKISSYVRFLQENPKEVDILFKELLIGVTNFFRDPNVWEKLQKSIIPTLFSGLKTGTILRAWIPGCSTGEEAYSLAIIFQEELKKFDPYGGFSLQIFATDLNADAIEIARKGVYPASIAADVSEDRLNRFFVKTDSGYRVNNEIREMVVFANHNIILHPPFTKIDILSCRNLLIYIDPELQSKLLGLFYYSLNPEGIMLLGCSESLGIQSHLFMPLDTKLKIFKRSATALNPESIDFPSSFSQHKPGNIEKQQSDKATQNIQTLADQLLLQNFSPAGVLANDNGDIIYFSGHTGKYLEPAVGKANLNIFAMLREGLRNDFPAAFHKALIKKTSVVLRNIKASTSDTAQTIDVNIQWIDKPEPLKGMLMIIFTDGPEISDVKQRAEIGYRTTHSNKHSELEKDLQDTREEMQNTFEEMQTSQEELKSTNEELQSTNEELQSTNEELTTSKEEMQSLNEELQTLNAELQSKIDDYSRVNNDMKNLLNSTDIATLFLDKELNIRRYTNQATKIFKLIKSDIGRPFTDLVSDLRYPELSVDALEVLRTLIFIQKQIPAKDGRWFTIRIMPYRTYDDRIDGLVITFINNSDVKQLEENLIKSEQLSHFLLRSSSDVLISLSAHWEIQEFNGAAEKFFGIKRENVITKNYFQLLIPGHQRKETEKKMDRLLNKAKDCKFTMQMVSAKENMQMVEWTAKILLNSIKSPVGMIISTKSLPSHD